jgi:hypothetical protein
MRTVAVSVRHTGVISRYKDGKRLRNTLCVLACRGAAHGKEREQASKKKTTQKRHATWARSGLGRYASSYRTADIATRATLRRAPCHAVRMAG